MLASSGSGDFDHGAGLAAEAVELRFGDAEGFAKLLHIYGTFAVLDGDPDTVFLTAVLALAVLVRFKGMVMLAPPAVKLASTTGRYRNCLGS